MSPALVFDAVLLVTQVLCAASARDVATIELIQFDRAADYVSSAPLAALPTGMKDESSAQRQFENCVDALEAPSHHAAASMLLPRPPGGRCSAAIFAPAHLPGHGELASMRLRI